MLPSTSARKVVRCDPITGQIRARGKFNYISVKCERFLFQSESPVHGCVDHSRLIFSPTSVLVGGDAGRYGATRLAGNVKAKGLSGGKKNSGLAGATVEAD